MLARCVALSGLRVAAAQQAKAKRIVRGAWSVSGIPTPFLQHMRALLLPPLPEGQQAFSVHGLLADTAKRACGVKRRVLRVVTMDPKRLRSTAPLALVTDIVDQDPYPRALQLQTTANAHRARAVPAGEPCAKAGA